MRLLLIIPLILCVASILGCGQGYETRKSPGAGAGDPTAVIQELESSLPRPPGAPAPAAKAEPAEADKAEQPATSAPEEKPAEAEKKE